MRFRAGSTLIYPLLLAITVTSGVALNSGCGGGSSSKPSAGTGTPTPTPTPTTTPELAPVNVRPAVIWAPRSRQVDNTNAVTGPSSALSVKITLKAPDAADDAAPALSETFNRNVPISGARQNYVTNGKVKPGIYNVVATFFANNGAGGAVVGVAATSAMVNADGTLSATFATIGKVQKVEVVANQSVKIGETKAILYTAKDADGNTVAVSPGSGFVQVADATSTVSGQPSIRVSGDTVTGLNPYKAQVTVAVDNAVSSATDIKVLSNVTLDVNPKNAVVSILQPAAFTATVANDGPAGSRGVDFSIKEGAVAGSLTQPSPQSTTANFTAGGVSSEGNYTLVATSHYDPNVSVSLPFKVQSQVAVTIDPGTVTAVSYKGGTQKFNANVSQVPEGADKGVVWSVSPAEAGSITADGLFTAGNFLGKATVRATSNFDNRKFSELSFNVSSLATVKITTVPPAAGLSIKQPLTLAALVEQVPAGQDTGVTWSLAPGTVNATITANGEFTAIGSGDYVVIATSKFDPTKTATVTVKVRSFVAVALGALADISIKETRTFTSTVTGVPPGFDNGVTWTIAPATGTPAGTAIGTIDANTGRYTAPASPVNVVVTATSKFDPGKSASQTLAVKSFVTVATNPVGPVQISIKDKLTFTATVGGVFTGGDASVTWTIKPAATTPTGADIGSIDSATGVYNSPAQPVDLIVVATSNFDPTKSKSVNVKVVSNVVVTPNPAGPVNMSIKDTKTFAATVAGVVNGGDTGVTWSLQPDTGTPSGADLGTIDANTGVYNSPASPVNVLVVATSKFDPAKNAKVSVKVVSNVVVTPNPAGPIDMSIKDTKTFAATVAGVVNGGDTGVTWSLQPDTGTPSGADLGTINANTGVYNSPASPVNVLVVATSKFDPAKNAKVKVSVKSFVVPKINGSDPAIVSINASRTFTATVDGVVAGGDTGVTWSIAPVSGGDPTKIGSINATTGVYSAPDKEVDLKLTATSKFDPTKTKTITVQVRSGNLGVIIK